MKFDYKFIDPDVNNKERLPIVSSSSLDLNAGVIHHLLAENGQGKTWLLNYIIYSLLESPGTSNDEKWALSPEKKTQVEEFKQHDGHIEGFLSLDIDKIELRSQYELGKSVKREYRLKGAKNWSDLSDTILRRYLNVAYLVPMEPAKRVGKIKTQLMGDVSGIKSADDPWISDMRLKIREASREGRNQGQINAWEKAVEGIKKKIETCRGDVKKQIEEVSGYLALRNCQKLKALLNSVEKDSKKLTELNAKLEKLPKQQPKPNILKITNELEKARKEAHNSLLLKKLRGLIALCADQPDSVHDDFKGVRLIEDARNILDLLSPNGVASDIDESPFVINDPRSISAVKQIPRFAGRRSELVQFFDSHFANESSDAKILEFLKAFISLIEEYREEKALDEVLREKLGSTIGVDGLERTLVAEINRVGSGNIRLELDKEMSECLSGLAEAVLDYEKCCKKYVKAQAKLAEAANHTDPSAAQRVSLRGEITDLRGRIDESNADRRRIVEDLNGFKPADWTNRDVVTEYEKRWHLAFAHVDSGALERSKKKLAEAEAEQSLIEGKIAAERRKPEDVLDGMDKVRANQLSDLAAGFTQQLGSWVNGLASDSLSEADTKFFGGIVAIELGGEIWFDGENQKIDYVDMGSKKFVLKSGAKPGFNRLSQAQAGEVTFRLLLRPMLENGNPTILLFDESGDMDDKTWGNIRKWMAPYRDRITFMMKVGVKTGAVELKTERI